jgi:hypothetical protein
VDNWSSVSTEFGDRRAFSEQVVELSLLRAGQERGRLRGGVDESRTVGIAGVANRDASVAQSGHLDAVPFGVAVPALDPTGFQ